MASDWALATGAAAAIAGVLLLRLAWGQVVRSRPLNGAGWSALSGATLIGWMAAGAWGVAVEALFAMAAAFALLAHAGWASPAPLAPKPVKQRPIQASGAPLRIGRRLATFLLVIFGGMAASTGVALGGRWAARIGGAGEADANVLALFLMPLGWAIMSYALLMGGRRRQWVVIAAGVAAAVPAILAGEMR